MNFEMINLDTILVIIFILQGVGIWYYREKYLEYKDQNSLNKIMYDMNNKSYNDTIFEYNKVLEENHKQEIIKLQENK